MISVNLAFNGYVGLSTDSKPTEDVNNGSKFYEMDTAKSYMFDAEGLSWIEQPAPNSPVSGTGISVTWDGTTDELDKTWQEIHDAMEAGSAVTLVHDGAETEDCAVVISCANSGEKYLVYAIAYGDSSFAATTFEAATADDNPAIPAG